MTKFYATLSLLFFSVVVYGQKKPLDHDVYDSWQNISTSGISKDGNYLYYIVSPQEGDATLTIKTPKNETIGIVPRGANPRFSPDGNYIISLIKPFFSETREAKIKKKKPDEMPKDSLVIFNLAAQQYDKFANATAIKIPEDKGEYIAYLIEEQTPAPKPDTPKDSSATDSTKQERPARKKAQKNLYIHHLASGNKQVVERVDDFHFSKNGDLLVYHRIPEEKDSIAADAGLYALDLSSSETKHISSGKGKYKNISIDEGASQVAFTADKGDEKALVPDFKLYYYSSEQDSAIVLAGKESAGIPADWHVSGAGQVRFSKNGEKLFFGIAPIPTPKDTTLVEFEHAKVDIWHWQDDYLQTQQLVSLRRDLDANYLAVVYPKQNPTVIPLADLQLNTVRITEDADNKFALATSDFGRRIATQWEGASFQDIYAVSTIDGQRRLIAENIRGNANISPTGKYVLWFDRSNSNWYTHDIETGKTTQLNQDLAVNFANEDNDSPDDPNSYGIAGWSEDDTKVYIYDKFDIWEFDIASGKNSNLTNGEGRQSQVTFRYSDLGAGRGSGFGRFSSPTIINTDEPLILSSFNHVTKENGFFKRAKGRRNSLTQIVVAPFRYSQIQQAEDAPVYIYTKENYIQSPDLYVSEDFVSETKLSETNPQQANYNWGTAELIHWTTPAGHAAEGILYKPEDFDPSKKYPVIAYFYERLSDGLYSYIPPTPTPSRLNISFFVSNGYLVLAPDIRYEIGYPGKSAEEYVNSGMEYLKTKPWVNGEKLAIQGQSWGGYQVSHLITRTDMYAAAWAGAPVVNMTSAYGGIRWQTGMNRQFQYERTQSRIGATLWENPELYIENSPLFHLPAVTTPVVIMHNDEDGAVPWYQGIEMFTALRRLQKPVWMLNYNGDAHNLVQRQNRKDIQRRQQQFFDHYLKDLPAAPWITGGVPATSKGIEWGF